MPTAAAEAAATQAKEEPEIKKHFTIRSTGTHVFGGTGRMSGKTSPCYWYACNQAGCPRGASHPIKQVGGSTRQLFQHLEVCQPALCKQLRAKSAYSPVQIGEDGEEYTLYSFEEALPHHIRYVQKCFRGFDHFYETRANNGLVEYVQGFNKRASLPHEQTCQQILEVYEELCDEKIMAIISTLKATYGLPCCGSTSDLWSLKSCRQSFGCCRGSFIIDGDVLAALFGDGSCKGQLFEFSPILGFDVFDETRHTGAAIARWKQSVVKHWKMERTVGLATEDGASNNLMSNRTMGQKMKVCLDHDLTHALLYSVGEAGSPSQNLPLKAFLARAGKQSAAFSRSVVDNVSLQEEQLKANPDLKPHQALTTKTKNATRWLGLREMANRNRRIGPEIRLSLTGTTNGFCLEQPAAPAARPTRLLRDLSDENLSDIDSDEPDGDEQEEGNRAANKKYPLAHRCLSMEDFKFNEILESLLDRSREVTMHGSTTGLDLGMGYVIVGAMRDEAKAQIVQIVSGRDETEVWTEVNASSLPEMFQTHRRILAEQLTNRFNIDGTPDRHTLLALKMHPKINTSASGDLMKSKQATQEQIEAEYKRALRRQAIMQQQRRPLPAAASPAAPSAPIPAPTDVPPAAPTAPTIATTTAPLGKKRRGLMGFAMAAQKAQAEAADEDQSPIDIAVKAEMEKFEVIKEGILAAADDEGNEFNLLDFWADHMAALPLHFGVYVAEGGCKKIASADVETVFSGAGKFTDEAGSTRPTLLRRIVKLHYNWKYPFLRPSLKEVEDRYLVKWPRGKTAATAASVAARAAEAVAAAAAAAAATRSDEADAP